MRRPTRNTRGMTAFCDGLRWSLFRAMDFGILRSVPPFLVSLCFLASRALVHMFLCGFLWLGQLHHLGAQWSPGSLLLPFSLLTDS